MTPIWKFLTEKNSITGYPYVDSFELLKRQPVIKARKKAEKRKKNKQFYGEVSTFWPFPTEVIDWNRFEGAHLSLLRYLIIPYLANLEVSEVIVSKKIKTIQIWWKSFCLFLRNSTNLGYLVVFFLLGTQWRQNNSQGRLSFCADVMKRWNRTLNCVLASYLVQKSWKTTVFFIKLVFIKKMIFWKFGKKFCRHKNACRGD